MFKYLLLISVFAFIHSHAQPGAGKNTETGHLQNLSSLVFVENKGQIADQNNNIRNDIDFKLAGNGINVFIGKGQLHYQFNKEVKGEKLKPESSGCFESYRMDVSLVGANTNAELIT